MKISNLSDSALAKIASDIEIENKRRAARKVAATAIIAILKKHNLSITDIPELELGKKRSTKRRKKSVVTKAKNKSVRNPDKRINVAFKYKNPNGSNKWSGRGRAPKWVSAILEKNNISLEQFKTDKRYKI